MKIPIRSGEFAAALKTEIEKKGSASFEQALLILRALGDDGWTEDDLYVFVASSAQRVFALNDFNRIILLNESISSDEETDFTKKRVSSGVQSSGNTAAKLESSRNIYISNEELENEPTNSGALELKKKLHKIVNPRRLIRDEDVDKMVSIAPSEPRKAPRICLSDDENEDQQDTGVQTEDEAVKGTNAHRLNNRAASTQLTHSEALEKKKHLHKTVNPRRWVREEDIDKMVSLAPSEPRKAPKICLSSSDEENDDQQDSDMRLDGSADWAASSHERNVGHWNIFGSPDETSAVQADDPKSCENVTSASDAKRSQEDFSLTQFFNLREAYQADDNLPFDPLRVIRDVCRFSALNAYDAEAYFEYYRSIQCGDSDHMLTKTTVAAVLAMANADTGGLMLKRMHEALQRQTLEQDQLSSSEEPA